MKNASLTIAAALLLCAGAGKALADRDLLTQEEIKRVVADHAPEIRDCYERHGKQHRRATGEVNLGMVVEREGTVRRTSISVEAPGVKGDRFERCVVAKASQWRFPAKRSPTEFQYPFLFHHTKAPGAGPRR